MPGMFAIVDNEPEITRALGMWLELRGLQTTLHLSAESLLKIIHQQDGHLIVHPDEGNPAEFQLQGVVIDLILPGINGIELARRLRRLDRSLPITLITALRSDERVRYGKLPPSIQCLEKPFNLNALEASLFQSPL